MGSILTVRWRHSSRQCTCPLISQVTALQQNNRDPFWNNGYFSWADARIAYAITSHYKPKQIIEVGSGNSTKFLRKAIDDFSTGTTLTSVDPSPRSEIGDIAHEVIPTSVLNVDLKLFERLRSGDVLFWDGSHVCFNRSDVCTLFLEVLPMLPAGVLVHVHDIYLPYAGANFFQNVTDELATHSHSEQFMLATLLLNSNSLKIILPVYHLWKEGLLNEIGASFWLVTG